MGIPSAVGEDWAEEVSSLNEHFIQLKVSVWRAPQISSETEKGTEPLLYTWANNWICAAPESHSDIEQDDALHLKDSSEG